MRTPEPGKKPISDFHNFLRLLRNNDVIIQFKQLTIFTFSTHANFETFFETAKLTLITMMLIDGTGSENQVQSRGDFLGVKILR